MNRRHGLPVGGSDMEIMFQLADILQTLRDALMEVSMTLQEAQFVRDSDQNSAANTYLDGLIVKIKSE